MREIEFRGKNKYCSSWVIGYYYEKNGTVSIKNDYQDLEIATETLGQYTGLKDKNGTKIFEGDIIAHGVCAKSIIEYGWAKFICHRLFKDGREFKSIDEYNEQEFMDLCNVYECEVIGNIYDNPELLEV